MAEPVLPGYTFDRSAGRYRSNATGRFVSQRDIERLLEAQIADGELRLSELTTAFHEEQLDASVWAEQMRTALILLYLQNTALGAGGFAQLTRADHREIDIKIREELPRIEQFARDIQDGNSSLAQSLTRVAGYVGGARIAFWVANRRAARTQGENTTMVERRHLDPAAQHCSDCPGYYDQGWQAAGILPVPGVDCQCRNNCRCRMSRREVPAAELAEWIGTKR